MAAIVIELPRKERMSILTLRLSALRLFREPALDAIPRLGIDDRPMEAVMDLSLMAKPSCVDRVRQDVVDMSPADEPSARLPARSNGSNGQTDVLRIKDDL